MPKFKITFKKELIEEVEVDLEYDSSMHALDESRIKAKELTAKEENLFGKTIWTVFKIKQLGE